MSRPELILRQLDALPTLPAVAVRVLEMTGANRASAVDLARVIEGDPALASRVLSLTRAAASGARGTGDDQPEAANIERAVVLLGFEAVRAAVLAVGVFETFERVALTNAQPPATGDFSRDAFWKHCLAVACAAELLATKLPAAKRVDPSEAFCCGLLHDIGKIALDAALPKSFARVVAAADVVRGDIAEIERQVIGIDHNRVGKRLAEKWQLPDSVRDTAWLHHLPPGALPPTVARPHLVHLVTLADAIVREQHLGYSGNHASGPSRQALLEATGIPPEQVGSVLDLLIDKLEARMACLGLKSAQVSVLYREALSQANRELVRVSDQLAAKTQRLRSRSRYFDALAHFQQSLRHGAGSTRDVLAAVGQSATEVLETKAVALFSFPPTATDAETLIVDAAGRLLQTGVAPGVADDETPPALIAIRPTQPAEGIGPILPAEPELQWLTAQCGPRLIGASHAWIPLVAEGVCIGGVMFGTDPQTAQTWSNHADELAAVAAGWALALRAQQVREASRDLSEQLAETSRKLVEAQDEITRNRALVSVAEMAAGAAHEMNNPLMVISGRSQLLYMSLRDLKQKAAAKLIWDNAQRLSEMITQMMKFARPERAECRVTWMDDLVSAAVTKAKQCEDAQGRRLEITLPELPALKIDRQQVSLALASILENAFQATEPNTGAIEINAAHDPFGQRAVLTVTDNGCGMDEPTRQKVFDPFFSAKPAGRRRGMGLSVALRQVEASGGTIRIESRPGVGTRVIMLLPTVTPDQSQAAPRQRA